MNEYIYIFSVFGVLMALHTLAKLIPAKRSAHWPHVTGTLEGINIRKITALDEQYLRKLWVSLHLSGRYTYEVDGYRYEGKRITLSDHIVKPLPELKRIAERLGDSGTCLVYYNPKNPKQACLIPGASGWLYLPFVTALAFIAFPFVWRWFL